MSYHISTYGYTHKMFGCKRTRLDFGKPYRKEKTKNAKMLCILAFFIVLKFGVTNGIRTRLGGLRGLCPNRIDDGDVVVQSTDGNL